MKCRENRIEKHDQISRSNRLVRIVSISAIWLTKFSVINWFSRHSMLKLFQNLSFCLHYRGKTEATDVIITFYSATVKATELVKRKWLNLSAERKTCHQRTIDIYCAEPAPVSTPLFFTIVCTKLCQSRRQIHIHRVSYTLRWTISKDVRYEPFFTVWMTSENWGGAFEFFVFFTLLHINQRILF